MMLTPTSDALPQVSTVAWAFLGFTQRVPASTCVFELQSTANSGRLCAAADLGGRALERVYGPARPVGGSRPHRRAQRTFLSGEGDDARTGYAQVCSLCPPTGARLRLHSSPARVRTC